MSEPMILSQRIKLPYRYTAGPLHRAGLFGLAEKRLISSTCANCGFVTAPARPFCPDCSGAMAESGALEPVGTLRSWTTRGSGADTETVGRIVIDGADNAMYHRLDGEHDWSTGDRVAAVWSDDPTTEITAIVAFGPA